MGHPAIRRMVWCVVLAAAAVAVALAAAPSLGAQDREAPRGFLGLSFVAGDPVGIGGDRRD